MSRINKIRVHTARPSEANPYVAVAVFVPDTGDFGTFFRSFSRKRIDTQFIAERDMTQREIERVDKSWRIVYYRYTSWEKLIKDEWAETGNHEWCLHLAEMARLKPCDLTFLQIPIAPLMATPTQLQLFSEPPPAKEDSNLNA